MSNVEDNSIPSSIRQQAKRQRFHARLIRFLIIGFFIISFLTLPFWALYLLVGGIGPGLFSEVPPYIPYIIFLLVYGTFFVIPFLLCLPVVLPLAIKQKNVSRIIVFRKFNNEESKKALSRIIRSGLANYGHVFTLSDSKFKVKWYVRIPVFMGQLSLFNFRQRNITRRHKSQPFVVNSAITPG
ncbi:MAG: hypothetical protein IPI66_13490 [Chitinophagaceae bacterium]|nr:hypothetical protein [Chitinophagaceae bacterium]